MPTFRCPKCRTRLTADGSTPTVNCTQCGQLCAIPVQATPLSSITRKPAPVSMADAMAEDEVVDVVAAGDDDEVMDVVAVGGAKKKKKSSKSGKSAYKKPIYLHDDDRDEGWFSVPNIIVAATVGVGFLLLIVTMASPHTGGLLLATWGMLLFIPGRILMLIRGGQEGEFMAVFFVPFYDLIFGLSQGSNAVKILIVEYAGFVYFGIGYMASGGPSRMYY